MTDRQIREEVKKIQSENKVSGYSKSTGIQYHYTMPAPGRYPSQFFWDSCFHVFILTAIGEHNLAKNHLNSLFALQTGDGFVGHIIYWNQTLPNRITDIFQSRPSLGWNLFRTHSSALIQPPFVAQAVLNIFNNDRDLDFLRRIYPKLKNYYAWLANNRDFDGDGLLSIISPFESGMDWKPSFDEVVGFKHGKANWKLFLKFVLVDFKNFMHDYNLHEINKKGYFLVKEVCFNTVYVQNLRAMATLGKIINDTDVKKYRVLAEKVLKNMELLMYDDEDAAFYDLYGKTNEKIKVLTPTIFFPVVIEGLSESLARKVIDRHLFNLEEFALPFPIPSVAKNDPSFSPNESIYIWRGPTWIFFNWFMFQFLKLKGYDAEAKLLIDCIKALIEKSGFREYYDPYTGEGYGAKNFTWTGLIVDMINK